MKLLRNIVAVMSYVLLAYICMTYKVKPVEVALLFYGLSAIVFKLESIYSFIAGGIIFMLAAVFSSSQTESARMNYILYGLFFWVVAVISFFNVYRGSSFKKLRAGISYALSVIKKHKTFITVYGVAAIILIVLHIPLLEDVVVLYALTTLFFKIESGKTFLAAFSFILLAGVTDALKIVGVAEVLSATAFYLLFIGVITVILESRKPLR